MNALALAEMKAVLKRRGYDGWTVRQQPRSYNIIAVYDDSDTIRWAICADDLFGRRNGQWHAWDGTMMGVCAGPTAAAALDIALDLIESPTARRE